MVSISGLVSLHGFEQVKESRINPQGSCFWIGTGLVTWEQCLPCALVGGCSAELVQRCLEPSPRVKSHGLHHQHRPSLAVPLGRFCYTFYPPHEGANCFTPPRAALSISCVSIHLTTWNGWVLLVFLPMQRQKRASHEWSSNTYEWWTVWGMQLFPAKWMKHWHSAPHRTPEVVRARMKYELKAFA